MTRGGVGFGGAASTLASRSVRVRPAASGLKLMKTILARTEAWNATGVKGIRGEAARDEDACRPRRNKTARWEAPLPET